MSRCWRYVWTCRRRLSLWLCNCMGQMRHLQRDNVGLMSQNSLRLHPKYLSSQLTRSIYCSWKRSWTGCFLKMHSDQLVSDLTAHHLVSAVWGSCVTKSLARRIRLKDRRVNESAKCEVTSGCCKTWIPGELIRSISGRKWKLFISNMFKNNILTLSRMYSIYSTNFIFTTHLELSRWYWQKKWLVISFSVILIRGIVLSVWSVLQRGQMTKMCGCVILSKASVITSTRLVLSGII